MTFHIANAYCGLGDDLNSLYVVEGIRQLGYDVKFYSMYPNQTQWWFDYNDEARPLSTAPDDACWIFGRGNEVGETVKVGRVELMRRRAQAYLEDFGVQEKLKLVRPILRRSLLPQLNLPTWDVDGIKWEPEKTVLLFPNSYWSNRTWPKTHWRMLAKRLEDGGHQVGTVGMNKENSNWLTNRFVFGPLPQILGLIKRCRLVICNDSGPAHMAAVLNRPAIAIHAMFSPECLYAHAERVYSVYSTASCAGCHSLPHRGYMQQCSTDCVALSAVSPDQVISIFNDIYDNCTIASRTEETPTGSFAEVVRESI